MYQNLGKKVICSAFYKEARDRVYIDCYDKNNCSCNITGAPISKAVAMRGSTVIKELNFEGDGVFKHLYTLVNKEFKGVCVGEVLLPVIKYLYSDTDCLPIGGEVNVIHTAVSKQCECYVVYFTNNRKHYVPKDCCTFVEE